MSSATPPSAKKPTVMESLRLLVGGSRGYLVVNLINFGDGVAYFGILTLLTLFQQRDVGFSEHAAGMTVSMFTGVVTLFMLFCGFIVDRIGVRRGLTLALLLLFVGRTALLGPSLTGPGAAAQAISITSLLLMAVGSGVVQPALYAGVKEYTDPRSASMGYAFLYSIMNLGIVGELFISPYLRKYWAAHVEHAGADDAAAGITGPFLFCALFTLLLLVVHLSLFTRRVEQRDRLVAEPDEDQAKDRADGDDKPKGLLERFRGVPVMDPRFIFFIFILLPVRTLFAHQWLTMPDYVTRCFSTDVGKHFEWLSGINPVIIVVFVPLITALTQRAHVLTMMIIGSTVTALSTFLLVPEPNLTLLIAYMILFSLGEAAWSSRFLEYVADLAPAGRVGAYMGVAMLPWFMAKFTTGFYSGWMLGIFVPKEGPQSPSTMWLIYGVIALLSPIGLIAARRWLLGGVPSSAKADLA